MSLILDALNRARQQENAVPGLATQHPLEQLTARRRQLLLWGALAVAVVIIAWLVVDRWRAPASPGEDIGAPVAELSRNIGSAVNSVTTELKARAAAAEQAAGAVSAPGAAPVAIAPASTPQAAVQADAAAQPPVGQSAAAAAPQTAAQAAPQTIQDDAVVQLYQNRDLEEEPPVREPAPTSQRGVAQVDSELQRTSEVERILREARDEMENASLEEHSAPFLADLSQLSKDAIPTLYYQRHDYSSNASESSVTMNGSTVKAGGSVVPGMKVEEILPDSVVLNYQGTQFRLRALNSWVNL
jgi:general secretion pathway protein B